MAYIVTKRKNGVTTLEAVGVNLKRARAITSHPFDKKASYTIAEIIEKIPAPSINNKIEDYEDRESLQEDVD